MNQLQKYIHTSKYARLLGNRRETWDETCNRHADYYNLHDDLRLAIKNMDVLPSMRSIMTAGPALDRDHVAQYNCSYAAIDDVRRFDETLYILMCGAGVGFSCERQIIAKLPVVGNYTPSSDDLQFPNVADNELSKVIDGVIYVADSKYGWASALRHVVLAGYAGRRISWNLEKIRPAGSLLTTFGGQASGPEPLNRLLTYTRQLFDSTIGRRLNSIEVHDLVCNIADVVVVGGVRRAALLSLSNLSDDRMRYAKSGEWWRTHPYRALANNSVAYTEKPEVGMFMREWLALYESRSGERGIINREALRSAKPERRNDAEFGVNPCAEAVLRSCQFCNLTTVVARPNDNIDVLLTKIGYATEIGVIQSTKTDFRYLSSQWKQNTEEERLCGVSITGIMDNKILREASSYVLGKLRDHAINSATITASTLGVSTPAAITCIKPEGTVSSLTDTSAGIHSRYSPFYIRRVRQSNNDPLTAFMKDHGVPNEPCAIKPNDTTVFSFAIKSPVFTYDETAIMQMERWAKYKRMYCEHNPSATIAVMEHEWLEVCAWVYKHFNDVSGISFLPKSNHIYKQAPYESITKAKYESFPKLDIPWESFNVDRHIIREPACTANGCDL